MLIKKYYFVERARGAVQAFLHPASLRSPVALEPDYLRLYREPERYVEDGQKGTFVFLVQFASRGSGGLADVLHLGLEIEKQYGLSVYFRITGPQDEASVRENIRWTCPDVRDEQILGALLFVPEYLCATAWPTAYEVRATASMKKLYFVQDYEPLFARAGLDNYYAEESYRLGLRIFTLGPWLKEHLHAAHGIRDSVSMPFPCTDEPKAGIPHSDRDTVAFYVQPDKEHRGAKAVIEAARLFSRSPLGRHYRIVVFGSRTNDFIIPDFECEWRGILDKVELDELFCRTRVGVCMSFTNLSLVTMRFLAGGCGVVDLNLPNVSSCLPAPVPEQVRLVSPMPDDMVDAIRDLIDHPPSEQEIKSVIRGLMDNYRWPRCAASLESLFAGAAG